MLAPARIAAGRTGAGVDENPENPVLTPPYAAC